MRQLLVISLILGILVMASSASAYSGTCNGEYSYVYPITVLDNSLYTVLVNDTYGVNLGDGIQWIAGNSTINGLCYNDSTTYALYNDDTKMPTHTVDGNVSDYLSLEKDLILYADLSKMWDNSVYNRSYVEIGAAPGFTRGASCHMGSCWEGDGTNEEFLDFGYVSAMSGGSEYTLCGWAYRNSVAGGAGNDCYIVGAGDRGDCNSGSGIRMFGSAATTTTYICVGGTSYYAQATGAVVGSWQHWCSTYDGETLRVYRDGIEIASDGTMSGALTALNSDDNLTIGCGSDDRGSPFWNYQPCNGLVDEVMAWNRTLSGTEIMYVTNNTAPDGFATLGSNTSLLSQPNVTLTLTVDPATVYNLTDANFSIFYNESNGNAADITVNITVNGNNITDTNPATHADVAPGSYIYVYVEAANYSKHDNITLVVNLTTNISETDTDTLDVEIQNSPATAPSVVFNPHSIIIGDTFNATGSSTDADGDTLTYWYLYGWNNGTNFTGWSNGAYVTVNASDENNTYMVYVMANDGEENGTSGTSDINVTHLQITNPGEGDILYGKTFYFSFDFTTEQFQPCTEYLNTTGYDLGNVTGNENNSRYVWYGDHIYIVNCTSLQDPTRSYSKNVSFSNYYANWTVSIMTENDWTAPLNITEANLSIIITCEGGETYVYNFTGTEISGVYPPCDVETVSAKVDYASDSYLRERMPPCEGICDVEIYMVDALIYTVLQIPIYMSDYPYYDSKIELYKMSGGNHYTIAEGYFDVEHKYVTYLTKDNTYLIRLTKDGVIRDIGFLYAATATAQYLSLSEITLRPDITLITDNLLMAAEFDDPTANQSTLRIQYTDLMNLTTDVRILVYSDRNNTAWYDNTITGYSNFTITINNVNTTRHSVHFIVNHIVLGNSPVEYTVGVGGFTGWDLGLPTVLSWLYNAFAFFIIMMTSFVITPENRLPGYIILLAEMGALSVGNWLLGGWNPASIALFLAFIAAGVVYEIRHRGIQ